MSFDSELKAMIIRIARRRRVYPVAILEEVVREKLNPFGHSDVRDSARYVAMLRKRARLQSDEEFLADLHAWRRRSS